MKLRPVFKMHGGKRYLADWIIHNFPSDYLNLTYLEPYCGATNVLLRKIPSHTEIVNDIDPGIFVTLSVLKDTPYEFQGRLKEIPYCESVFEKAKESNSFGRDIDFAINEFILRRMSRGGLKKAFAWSDRQRGGAPGDVNAWRTIIESLPNISERLQNVVIENKKALDFIESHANADTLIYNDPPYVMQTRRSHNVYDYEMTNNDHCELAELLRSLESKVVVSGYPSPLYDEIYSNWQKVERQVANHSSQQKIKQYKTECLWFNY